jgi:hypothetical protein
MNWIDFDIQNIKTWPIAHEKVFCVFRWSDGNFTVGRFNEVCIPVENRKCSWAYLMPYELKDQHIDVIVENCHKDMVSDVFTFNQVKEKVLSVLNFVFLLSRLHIYESTDILSGVSLNSHFNLYLDVETHFILRDNYEFYLVDTMGYSFCKNIIKLEVDIEQFNGE